MKSLFQKAAYVIGQAIRPTWIELDRSDVMAFIGDPDDRYHKNPAQTATIAINRYIHAMQLHHKNLGKEREAHPYLEALKTFREELERPHYFTKEDKTAPAVQEKTLQKLVRHSYTTSQMIFDLVSDNQDKPFSPETLEIIYLHDAVTALARKHKIGHYADGMADDVQCYIYADMPRLSKKHPEDFGLNPASPTIKWAESDRFPGNRYEPNI